MQTATAFSDPRRKAAQAVRELAARKRREDRRAAANRALIDGHDMGHDLAIERKLVEVVRDAAVPLDPDSKRSPLRITARAQKVWAPDRLSRGRNPAVGSEAFQAAQRYYDDYIVGMCGARPNQTRSLTRTDPWNRLPYSEQRAMRRQSWEQAHAKQPLMARSILAWCVLQITSAPDVAPTVETWAKGMRWGTERAVGFLAGVLEGLAVHYGFARPSRRGPSTGAGS